MNVSELVEIEGMQLDNWVAHVLLCVCVCCWASHVSNRPQPCHPVSTNCLWNIWGCTRSRVTDCLVDSCVKAIYERMVVSLGQVAPPCCFSVFPGSELTARGRMTPNEKTSDKGLLACIWRLSNSEESAVQDFEFLRVEIVVSQNGELEAHHSFSFSFAYVLKVLFLFPLSLKKWTCRLPCDSSI